MNSELFNQVLSILIPALAGLIATWFTVLGTQLKNKYEEKINTQVKKDVVQTAVDYVQQVYYQLGGEEKLQKAIEQASIILNEKNIPVSEVELKTLIESAVYGIKKGLYQAEDYANIVANQVASAEESIAQEAKSEGEEG